MEESLALSYDILLDILYFVCGILIGFYLMEKMRPR